MSTDTGKLFKKANFVTVSAAAKRNFKLQNYPAKLLILSTGKCKVCTLVSLYSYLRHGGEVHAHGQLPVAPSELNNIFI